MRIYAFNLQEKMYNTKINPEFFVHIMGSCYQWRVTPKIPYCKAHNFSIPNSLREYAILLFFPHHKTTCDNLRLNQRYLLSDSLKKFVSIKQGSDSNKINNLRNISLTHNILEGINWRPIISALREITFSIHSP